MATAPEKAKSSGSPWLIHSDRGKRRKMIRSCNDMGRTGGQSSKESKNECSPGLEHGGYDAKEAVRGHTAK